MFCGGCVQRVSMTTTQQFMCCCRCLLLLGECGEGERCAVICVYDAGYEEPWTRAVDDVSPGPNYPVMLCAIFHTLFVVRSLELTMTNVFCPLFLRLQSEQHLHGIALNSRII